VIDSYYTSIGLKISFEISNEDGVTWLHECLVFLKSEKPLFVCELHSLT